MSKITLTPLVNLTNQTTAVNAINANSAIVQTAFNNTVSRDGASPNQMNAVLDMNSNQILNLPSPSTSRSPVRLVDINSTIVPTPAIITGNNVYTGNNSFSGTSAFSGNATFTAKALFKSGYPWFDVRAYGAVGDGSTDDTVACQSAINDAQSTNFGGAVVYFPIGQYKVTSPLNVAGSVHIVGSGMNTTAIGNGKVDVPIFQTSGSLTSLEDFTILGKGTNGDSGTFGAINAALYIGSSSGYIQNVQVLGGFNSIFITGFDNQFNQVFTNLSYGTSVVTTGANWFLRCAFDYAAANSPTNSRPYPNWASATGYTAGQVVVNGAALIQCTTSGTSGSASPTNKNIGFSITDNTVTWTFYAPSSFTGLSMGGSGTLENYIAMCDFSGDYNSSITIDQSGTGITGITQSVLSSGLFINHGAMVNFTGNEIASFVNVNAGYAGKFTMTNNVFIGTCPVVFGPNVSNFIVCDNHLAGNSITVVTGASDYYNICNNLGTTIVDNGTGLNKTITGNH